MYIFHRDILLLGRGPLSLPSVLQQLSSDFELSNFLHRERTSDWALRRRLHGQTGDVVLLLQRRADTLMDYAYKIRAPEAATRTAEAFAEWLVDQV